MGRIRVKARIAGRQVFFSGKTIEEAIAKREAAKAPAPDFRTFFDSGTVGDFAYRVYGPRKRQGIRATSRAKANGLLRLHILPMIGAVPIDKIGYADFEKLKTSIRKRNKRGEPIGDPSPKQVREVLLIGRELMGLYAMLERARGNQARDDWKLTKLPKIKRKKVRTEAEPNFTDILLDYAKGDWTEGPMYTAAVLMLRRGEIAELKWSAIDRQHLRIAVTEQNHPLLGHGAPTKSDERSIPITKDILAEIDSLGDKSSIYVFTQPAVKGGKRQVPIMPNELTKRVPKMIEGAGLKRKTLHELRAFGASNLNRKGVDPFVIMELLGHAKLDTSSIYVDSFEESKREAVQKGRRA